MKVIAISGYKQSGKDTVAKYLIENHNFVRVAFADKLKDMVASEYNIPRSYMDDPEFKESPLLHLPVIPKDGFTLELSKMLHKEFRTEGGSQALDYYLDPAGAFLGVLGRHTEQLYWTPRALCILKGSVNRAVTSDYWVSTTIDSIKNQAQDNVQLKITGNLAVKNESNMVVELKEKMFVISDLRYKSEMNQLREAFGKNLITVRIERFNSVNSTDPSEKDLDNVSHDVVLSNKSDLKELFSQIDTKLL